jgi:hypothetical protein
MEKMNGKTATKARSKTFFWKKRVSPPGAGPRELAEGGCLEPCRSVSRALSPRRLASIFFLRYFDRFRRDQLLENFPFGLFSYIFTDTVVVAHHIL